MINKSSNIIEKEFKNLRKELLDLTLRNQLLNFKSRAKTITILNQSPLNLFQTLVLQNAKMYFVAIRRIRRKTNLQFGTIFHLIFQSFLKETGN